MVDRVTDLEKLNPATVRQYAQEHFSVERMANSYAELYSEIASETAPGQLSELETEHPWHDLLLPIPANKLEEIAAPAPPRPQLVVIPEAARKADDLTLIDGKTFLSTNVAGTHAAGRAGCGLFYHDTASSVILNCA